MTDRHRLDRPQHCPQAGRELLVPTAFTPELIGEAMRVLQVIYRPGHQYKKAGVLCLDLVPDEEKQASLFVPVDPEREEKELRLMAAVAMGGGKPQGWQMRRERETPCYTTRIEDVPRARI